MQDILFKSLTPIKAKNAPVQRVHFHLYFTFPIPQLFNHDSKIIRIVNTIEQ